MTRASDSGTHEGITRPGQAADREGFRPGSVFAGHEIEAELGRGGMGVVYRARHLQLGRKLALKLIAPSLAESERFRSRFRREGRLAASIEHSNLVEVHHAGEVDGQLYLSMRIVDGPDLGALVDTEGPVEPRRAASLIAQIGAGLDAAHEAGLVHRDVKPSNILLERTQGGERVFVSDFGISRVDQGEEGGTWTGEIVGSADYVAPEQIEGAPLDRRADVYALGGVAHFLLTAAVPFPDRSEPAKLIAHTKGPRPAPSRVRAGIPRAVDHVIARAMAVRPGSRYASAGDLAAAFGNAVEGRSAPRVVDSVAVGARSLRPSVAFAIVAGLALIIAGIALLRTGAPQPTTGSDRPIAGSDDGSPAGERVSSIAIASPPAAITVGALKVWVAGSDGTLTGIDPRTGTVEPAVPVGTGTRPVALTVAFGSIWVLDGAGDALVRMDPDEGIPPRPIDVGNRPADVAVAAGSLWVSNRADGTVSRIDPDSNEVTATIPTGRAPRSIVAGMDRIWVADVADRSIVAIDPLDAESGRSIAVDRRPRDIAPAVGALWVLDMAGERLTKVDPSGDEPPRKLDVGPRARGLAASADQLWVGRDGPAAGVTAVDALTTQAIGTPVDVRASTGALAAGFGSIWVGQDDEAVARLVPAVGDGGR